MKNWNDFLTEFVLRAMVKNINEQYFSPASAAQLARYAWDAIQAAELPESEKAKQAPAPSFVSTDAIALIPSNSMELKEIARKALEVSGDNAQWVAIDASGGVWAYDLRPQCYEIDTMWDNTPDQGFNWHVCTIAPPDNFRDEIYEISKLLEYEQQV